MVYRDKKRGTWYVSISYVLWDGTQQRKLKRGFLTKREAQEWESAFMRKLKPTKDLRIEEFINVYLEGMKPRLKVSTYYTKERILRKSILPWFGKKRLSEITNTDVVAWQNVMLNYRDPKTGEGYSKSYLKELHNQLSSMLNYAAKYYGLKDNPARIVGNMGTNSEIEMTYWTLEEYTRFADAMMEEPTLFYAFEVLYWCGLREGELLALTRADVDLRAGTINVNKTYHRYYGEDIITTPKTRKSRRIVVMPEFLAEELGTYQQMLYKLEAKDRLFPITKHALTKGMARGAEKAGVKRIRVHDLRHSHVSLLINNGYSALAIADRVGHEAIDITFRYAHLFPSIQNEMGKTLNELKGGTK